jgi:hypothetical protein
VEVVYVVDTFGVVVSQVFHFASALGGLPGAFCRWRGGGCGRGSRHHWRWRLP